ncbi:MAG: FAD-binding protein [Sphingomonadales bacterium]|jgi:glycolate oxidase FAD binding subunit
MRYRPATTEELAAIIADAAARRETLAVTGSGSRPGIGPGAAQALLDVGGIGGRIDHDPAELTLTAPASTPLAEVAALLARACQCLAFEPPDPAGIWGRGCGTLGGAVASGLSGSRRPFAGAARDHVLGLTGVSGRGEIFRAGGKVLKNVTGFDLPRLLTGSRGTLAVITEVTLKVLPLAPAQATLLLPAATAAEAVRLMADALLIDGGITGAAWADNMAALRIEASPAALPSLLAAAQARLPLERIVEDSESRALWAKTTSLGPDLIAPDDIVWRCPLPASRAPVLAALLPPEARLRLDWAGALAWVLLPADRGDLDLHALVREAAGRDGHAERLSGASPVPARAPLDPGLAALSARVKAQFDPAGILSPEAAP